MLTGASPYSASYPAAAGASFLSRPFLSSPSARSLQDTTSTRISGASISTTSMSVILPQWSNRLRSLTDYQRTILTFLEQCEHPSALSRLISDHPWDKSLFPCVHTCSTLDHVHGMCTETTSEGRQIISHAKNKDLHWQCDPATCGATAYLTLNPARRKNSSSTASSDTDSPSVSSSKPRGHYARPRITAIKSSRDWITFLCTRASSLYSHLPDFGVTHNARLRLLIATAVPSSWRENTPSMIEYRGELLEAVGILAQRCIDGQTVTNDIAEAAAAAIVASSAATDTTAATPAAAASSSHSLSAVPLRPTMATAVLSASSSSSSSSLLDLPVTSQFPHLDSFNGAPIDSSMLHHTTPAAAASSSSSSRYAPVLSVSSIRTIRALKEKAKGTPSSTMQLTRSMPNITHSPVTRVGPSTAAVSAAGVMPPSTPLSSLRTEHRPMMLSNTRAHSASTHSSVAPSSSSAPIRIVPAVSHPASPTDAAAAAAATSSSADSTSMEFDLTMMTATAPVVAAAAAASASSAATETVPASRKRKAAAAVQLENHGDVDPAVTINAQYDDHSSVDPAVASSAVAASSATDDNAASITDDSEAESASEMDLDNDDPGSSNFGNDDGSQQADSSFCSMAIDEKCDAPHSSSSSPSVDLTAASAPSSISSDSCDIDMTGSSTDTAPLSPSHGGHPMTDSSPREDPFANSLRALGLYDYLSERNRPLNAGKRVPKLKRALEDAELPPSKKKSPSNWIKVTRDLQLPLGLSNLGHSCFLNAIVQVLLVSDLPWNAASKSISLFGKLRTLRHRMSSQLTSTQALKPQALFNWATVHLPDMEEDKPYDAAECFLTMAELPPLASHAGFTIAAAVSCLAADHSRIHRNVDQRLSLQIKEPSIHSIETALHAWMVKDQVESSCDRCDNGAVKVASSHRFGLLDAGDMLAIHLVRFKRDTAGRSYKETKHISFSPTLLLPMMREAADSQLVPASSLHYDLLAVVIHSNGKSRSLNNGHYIVAIRLTPADTSQWIMCDDEEITRVTWAFVSSQQAYLLFYSRRAIATAAA